MKDSPAIILASGLAGLLGAFFPTASGWVLEQSVEILGLEISAEKLGFFTVSRLLFVPPLLCTVLGALAMSSKFAGRKIGVLTVFGSLATMAAWLVHKTMIDQLSIVGVGPAFGLFLLFVSGLGSLLGGVLLIALPPKPGS